jgi:alkanesulfonate monooxygenase SsuD/methylene tetrahydromethanopterin reductase-like flavin-dependent oxidoreductase (luciferase family)
VTAPAARVGFGLLVPTLMEFEPCGLDRLREAARLGDEHDFDVLWVGDHLMFSSPILDAMVSIGVLGAMTTRVSVGTNVLQLPLRRPVDVAKSFATISYLTGGRLILGIGVGGEFGPEWAAAGISPRERGARCDEAIDALGWYWSGIEANGKYASSPGLAINPPPAGGRVPIWVGGRSGAAIRRAARCDGSLNIWVSPQRCTQICEEVRSLRSERMDEFTFGLELLAHVDDNAERARRDTREAISRLHLDPDALEKYVAFGSPAVVAERVLEYLAAGVQHVSFYLPGTGWSEQVRRIAEEVVPLVRASLSSVPKLKAMEG